jgi:ABC-type thiamine transport system ATPase subunit
MEHPPTITLVEESSSFDNHLRRQYMSLLESIPIRKVNSDPIVITMHPRSSSQVQTFQDTLLEMQEGNVSSSYNTTISKAIDAFDNPKSI